MNVLVTGGAGFIGSALVERLAAGGHRVAVVDDLSSGDPARVAGKADLHRADIARDDLHSVFAAAAPETVFHLAARSNVAESLCDPCRGAEVNVLGTVNLLRRSLAAGVRRFVFVSTGGALYGDPAPVPTPEDHPPLPCSPYGASKAAAEAYVRAMSPPGRMRHTILRYGNVYGPGEGVRTEPGIVASFARSMLDRVPPTIHGDGLNARDFVYLADAVDALLRVLETDAEGAFNIASGSATTVREVFEAVARAAGFGGAPVHSPARPGEVRRVCLDVQRARRSLGWSPAVPFADGIARTVASMRTTDEGSPAGPAA